MTREQKVQIQLEKELERLKAKLRTGYELTVQWRQGGNERLSGEVKGSIIMIYEIGEVEAIDTLRHEFFDYAVSQVIEPYKNITNRLISLLNEEAYVRKEKLVNGIKDNIA